MTAHKTLADVLRMYLDEVGWSERQLATRADVPRGTIRNWVRGVVKQPRNWQDLIQVATAMRLDIQQTSKLLQSACHPTVPALWNQVESDADRKLLTPWGKEMGSGQESSPFYAIPDLPYFVGREKELATLEAHLTRMHHPTLYMIHGMGGVGKTTLAARLAYRLHPHFRDGVLWARVDTSDTMSILKLFASAYGDDVSHYTDVETRSQAVRGILARKHALIVLDNVESSRQVEPLLPPTGPCAVLITTRRRYLRVARGAPQLHVRPFDPEKEEALALFIQLLGRGRVQQNRQVLCEMADLLGHLPLAVSIVAGRIAYEPGKTAVDLLGQLRHTRGKLDVITDEDQSVRASFSVSYQRLTPAQQHFFVTLGVFGGEDFGLEAITAVTQIPTAQARENLSHLSHLSLVEDGRQNRYRLHPLLRHYAREKIDDPQVFQRMVHYFTRYVEANAKNFEQLDAEIDNILIALTVAAAKGIDTAYIRLVVALCPFLAIRGLDDAALSYLQQAKQMAKKQNDAQNLAEIISQIGKIKERHGDLAGAEKCYRQGLKLAYSAEEPRLITHMLQHVGRVMQEQKAFAQAETFLQESLAFARENGYTEVVCNLLNNLGALAISHRGDYRQAIKLYKEGAALAEENDVARINSLFRLNLGALTYRMGAYDEADRYFRQCTTIAEKIGYRFMSGVLFQVRAWLVQARAGDEALAEHYLRQGIALVKGIEQRMYGFMLADLGGILARDARHAEADGLLQEALQIGQETGETELVIVAHLNRGVLEAEKENDALAKTHFQKALALARPYQDPWHLCTVLQEWGEHKIAQKEAIAALTLLAELHDVACRTGFRGMEALALYGLARAHWLQGDAPETQACGQQSLSMLSHIGHYRQEEVREWLQAVIDRATT